MWSNAVIFFEIILVGGVTIILVDGVNISLVGGVNILGGVNMIF